MPKCQSGYRPVLEERVVVNVPPELKLVTIQYSTGEIAYRRILDVLNCKFNISFLTY
jgi:hypothetical protein